MDTREKAIDCIHDKIADAIKSPPVYVAELASIILAIPELEAYFREKFDSSPSKLVAVRECEAKHPFKLGLCAHCHGTLLIKRTLTRKEAEEWAEWVAKEIPGVEAPSGERVEVNK